MLKANKKAQSLIEYGLILALVAIIALTVLSKFGKTITNVGEKTDQNVSKASDNAGKAYCQGLGSGYSYDETTGACKGTAATP